MIEKEILDYAKSKGLGWIATGGGFQPPCRSLLFPDRLSFVNATDFVLGIWLYGLIHDF